MAKRLTQEQIDARTVAWNEAVEALIAWMADQDPIQREQAEIVRKQIDAMADRWLSRAMGL
jgi:hypothetical protein